jgi:hypothetical protein
VAVVLVAALLIIIFVRGKGLASRLLPGRRRKAS